MGFPKSLSFLPRASPLGLQDAKSKSGPGPPVTLGVRARKSPGTAREACCCPTRPAIASVPTSPLPPTLSRAGQPACLENTALSLALMLTLQLQLHWMSRGARWGRRGALRGPHLWKVGRSWREAPGSSSTHKELRSHHSILASKLPSGKMRPLRLGL